MKNERSSPVGSAIVYRSEGAGASSATPFATVEEALAVFVGRCDEIALAEEPGWIPFVMENKLDGLKLSVRGRES